MNKSAFHQLSYGVYVVSTWDKGRATGCTANSAMQITSAPATIAVSINHDNYTNQCIRDTGKFAISILGENSNPGIIGTFGFKSGKDCDKFDQVEYGVKEYLPVVSDAPFRLWSHVCLPGGKRQILCLWRHSHAPGGQPGTAVGGLFPAGMGGRHGGGDI